MNTGQTQISPDFIDLLGLSETSPEDTVDVCGLRRTFEEDGHIGT